MATIDFDFNNTETYNTSNKIDIQTIIEHLNSVLPPFESITALKKHSTGKMKAPCPCCGGTDRFYLNIQQKRGYCTNCTPKGGDLIQWHMKINNVEHTSDLLKTYPVNNQYQTRQQPQKPPETPQNDKPKDNQKTVDDVRKRLSNLLNISHTQPIYDLMVSRRMLSPEIVKQAIDDGKLRYCNHAQKDSVAVPFFSLQGKEVDQLHSLQFISVDGEPFPFTVDDTGEGKNKVFQAGSNHSDGFFQAGIEFNQAVSEGKGIVIVEGVIDALTVAQFVPDVCCLATGSTSYTKKIEHLKEYIDRLNKMTVFYDNDQAGYKFVEKIYQTLNPSNNPNQKIHAVQWQDEDGQGFDANDLLKSGQADRINQMVNDAIEVNISESELEKEEAEETINELPKIIVEFCTAFDIYQQNAQPEWIIKNFIPKGETTLISSSGGLGKSMFSMWLAHHLATKLEIHKPDHGGNLNIDFNEYLLFEEFPIVQSGICSLFIQTENSNPQINFRLRKIAGDNIEPLKRLCFPVINGSALTSGMSFVEPTQDRKGSSAQFENWFETLINTIQDQTKQKIDLVWLDPLISFCGCNENDNNEMRKNLDVLTKISQQCEVTPIVIHHNGKQSGNTKEKDTTSYRGASAIMDWTRNLITMNKINVPEPFFIDGKMKTREVPAIKVKHDKCNVGKIFKDFKIRMDDHFRFAKIKDEVIEPETLKQINFVIQALKDMGGQSDKQSELVNKYKDLTGKTSTSTGKKYIKLAVEYGFLEEINNKGDKSYSYKLK